MSRKPYIPVDAATSDPDLSLSSYDYELPEEQIAQTPVNPRDKARLLVIESTPQHHHSQFYRLPEWLQPGDRLILNDTRVIPARLFGHKLTQGKPLAVEVLLLEAQTDHTWLALVKPGRRLKPGAWIEFGSSEQPLRANVVAVDPATGGRILQFELPVGETLNPRLEQLGQVPLPPYIQNSQANPDQYQTVYADRPGAVAAPTAGLHFTPNLLQRLQAKGIDHSFLTLHVGVGTFRPVEAADITTHAMHRERVEVPAATITQIHQTQAAGGRIIAVGTTVARALEAAAQGGTLRPYNGKTDLFIYPGYEWQVVEGLITNFHLPRSSLLMLVSALIGRQRLLDLYQVAIADQYRFYSFGDAMLILPSARIG